MRSRCVRSYHVKLDAEFAFDATDLIYKRANLTAGFGSRRYRRSVLSANREPSSPSERSSVERKSSEQSASPPNDRALSNWTIRVFWKIAKNKWLSSAEKRKLAVLSPGRTRTAKPPYEYGTTLLVKDGQTVSVGTSSPNGIRTAKLLLGICGKVRYVDLIDNVTVQELFDEATNRSSKVILEHRGDKYDRL